MTIFLIYDSQTEFDTFFIGTTFIQLLLLITKLHPFRLKKKDAPAKTT